MTNLEQSYSSSKHLIEGAEASPSVENVAGWVAFGNQYLPGAEDTDSLGFRGDLFAPDYVSVGTLDSKVDFTLYGDRLGAPEKNSESVAVGVEAESRLARVTFYWPEEGDFHTKRRQSATGVRLSHGHCAVDPKVIAYGSVVKIPGMGEFVAVDTGPAVASRRAARVAGRTPDERNALVVDVFCSNRRKARECEAIAPQFVVVSWYPSASFSQR